MDKAVKNFGPGGIQKAQFEMFSSTKYNGTNIMFADKTNDLAAISTKDYKQHLGKYWSNVRISNMFYLKET